MKKTISQATIDRLPLYYRTLQLAEDEGIEIISSKELGKRLDLTAEQIRKDLAFFGQFGRKGIGYFVDELQTSIGNILGLQHHWRLAIIGIGNLGAALANYKNFPLLGFHVAALFDIDEKIIGTEINGLRIYNFEKINSVASRKQIDIGVITVPAAVAQDVANDLIDAGIRGLWNFAPVKLNVPPEIALVNEDLSISLSALSFHLTQKFSGGF